MKKHILMPCKFVSLSGNWKLKVIIIMMNGHHLSKNACQHKQFFDKTQKEVITRDNATKNNVKIQKELDMNV